MTARSPLISVYPTEKNTDKSGYESIPLEKDMFLLKVHNQGSEPLSLREEVSARLIQFYFCLKGEATFSFNEGRYQQQLTADRTFLFYNPLTALTQDLHISAGGQLIFLFLTMERLHHMFVEDDSELAFLHSENVNKKFYAERPLTPGLNLVLNQFFSGHMAPSNRKLYYQGKTLELLSLYFDKGETQQAENCPFLHDESNVEKIRLAKRIVIERMQDPPGLKDLAREIGLNEYQLKAGFKNIYGSPVFQYLTDYKMEYARRLLDSQALKVNEVGYQVGYSNPSHFIAAFKKKFGTTPKKYVMALK
jgi:AraC-like DNA-binding protein